MKYLKKNEPANKDKELVRNILEEDRNIFRELINRYEKLVIHVVYGMLPNKSDLDDICQDVFIKVYENLDRFNFQAKLSTWIARIAYNTTLNFLAKRKYGLYEDLENFENDPAIAKNASESPAVWTEKRESAEILRRELEKIPARYGTILSLYHMEEMSYHEIGEILNLPEGTVKNYLYRARKMLKERLEKQFERKEL